VVVLFNLYTSFKLSIWKGRVECGTRAVETHSKILGGPEQTRKTLMEEGLQEFQSISESRLFRMYLGGAASRWPFKYVQNVQSYDCIITSAETIVVNYCSILPVLDYNCPYT
jgi:hypothetical protein